MDTLTFLSNAIRDLSWPVALLVAVLVTLNRLPSVASFLKSIKYKDVEIEFRENFAAARAAMASVKKADESGTVKVDADDGDRARATLENDKIEQLARIDPSVAMLEIWRKLENEIYGLMAHNGLIRFTTPVKFIGLLYRRGLISDDEYFLFNKLHDIRNSITHARPPFSPTLAEVIEFNEFVETLIKRFECIKSQPGYIDLED